MLNPSEMQHLPNQVETSPNMAVPNGGYGTSIYAKRANLNKNVRSRILLPSLHVSQANLLVRSSSRCGLSQMIYHILVIRSLSLDQLGYCCLLANLGSHGLGVMQEISNGCPRKCSPPQTIPAGTPRCLTIATEAPPTTA